MGIRLSGVDRKELFITTKLWNDVPTATVTPQGLRRSMDKLGLDYLDLYLIHWPNPPRFRDRWQEVNGEDLEGDGRALRVPAASAPSGISNFRPHHMEALLKTAKVCPRPIRSASARRDQDEVCELQSQARHDPGGL
jgi:diketogulonate reductase-like aldo/keto reductase